MRWYEMWMSCRFVSFRFRRTEEIYEKNLPDFLLQHSSFSFLSLQQKLLWRNDCLYSKEMCGNCEPFTPYYGNPIYHIFTRKSLIWCQECDKYKFEGSNSGRIIDIQRSDTWKVDLAGSTLFWKVFLEIDQVATKFYCEFSFIHF